MEYIYAAMLLHKAGQKIDDGSVKKVLQAASVKVDDAKVKALVSALNGVDIEKALKEATVVPTAAAPVASAGGEKGPKAESTDKNEEKKKEEEKKSEEESAEGLGALFG